MKSLNNFSVFLNFQSFVILSGALENIKQILQICFTCELPDLCQLSFSSWVAMLGFIICQSSYSNTNYRPACKQEQRNIFFLPLSNSK